MVKCSGGRRVGAAASRAAAVLQCKRPWLALASLRLLAYITFMCLGSLDGGACRALVAIKQQAAGAGRKRADCGAARCRAALLDPLRPRYTA